MLGKVPVAHCGTFHGLWHDDSLWFIAMIGSLQISESAMFFLEKTDTVNGRLNRNAAQMVEVFLCVSEFVFSEKAGTVDFLEIVLACNM